MQGYVYYVLYAGLCGSNLTRWYQHVSNISEFKTSVNDMPLSGRNAQRDRKKSENNLNEEGGNEIQAVILINKLYDIAITERAYGGKICGAGGGGFLMIIAEPKYHLKPLSGLSYVSNQLFWLLLKACHYHILPLRTLTQAFQFQQ